jgi:hypothetical protein
MSLISNSSSNRLRCNIPPQLPFFLLFREKGRLALFAFIFAILAFPVFAQDPEETFANEFKVLQDSCKRIMAKLPCSLGLSESESLPEALARAENDALIKLAISTQAFVSVHLKDSSSYYQVSNKENTLIANSQTISSYYAKLTKKDSSTYYRAIVLKVLGNDKTLFEEAKKEADAEKTSAAVPQLPSKTTLKQAASKTAPILLNIGKKALGLP